MVRTFWAPHPATHRALTAELELLSPLSLLPGLTYVTQERRGRGITLLTALPCHVTITPLPARGPTPLRPRLQLRSLPPAVGGSPQAEDTPLTGIGGALSQMGVTDRIPEIFTARNRREETKQAGTGGGGRELTEGVMAAALWDHVSRRPAFVLPVTCPQRPRSQRWRRDPPVTEAVATAAATGFQPLPSSSSKLNGSRPDPTQLLTPSRRL